MRERQPRNIEAIHLAHRNEMIFGPEGGFNYKPHTGGNKLCDGRQKDAACFIGSSGYCIGKG